ncbi:hypothetical protein BGX28_008461 [Mortierella sp. GBA30]|nr:hypothetical protein BGX28_008461 [Mortierella sp. GBA30]
MARIRETQTPLPSAETAKENLKRLSQRIHQRRTRARETILYDLHQGVKTVEAQVHKQVDMVLSRLKDAPGSKYAFALTHTFLTQIPQALSNTILPSAISAVADTVAGRTTNSLTTLRGRAGLDDEDDEDEDDEDEDDQENMDALDDINYQPQMALMQCHPHQDPGWSQQLSHEFGTIALAPSSSPCSCGSGAKSTTKAAESSTHMESKEREATISEPTSGCSSSSEYENGTVSISSAGASEFLSASTHHNYSTAASQVLSAALPSFIPSMVAPIVCVFSYPSPPTTKPNSPSHSTPSSPSVFGGSHGQPSPALTATEGQTFAAMQQKRISTEDTRLDKDLEAAIKADPGIAEVTSSAWTTAEREALFLAATRFRLRGQWSRVRAMMRLHRTDREIEAEYHRLYGEESEEDGDEDRQGSNDDLVAIKKESDADDGDADDEAEATVFMRFGGRSRPPSSSATSSALQDTAQMASLQSSLTDIQPLPITLAAGPSAQRYPHHHADGQDHCLQSRSHAQHQLCPSERFLRTPLKEKPLRIVKKEFMIDKRFTLEEIPIRL